METTLDQLALGEELAFSPTGISPERALVFITAGPVLNFVDAADKVGLKVLQEVDLEADTQIFEGFEEKRRTLYATFSTETGMRSLLGHWKRYQRGEEAPWGYKQLWVAFDLLKEIRAWGPEDRFDPEVRQSIRDDLIENGSQPVRLELEFWENSDRIDEWRADVEQRLELQGSRIIHQASIRDIGLFYEAMLVEMPSDAVLEMLDDPASPDSLATLDGLQFILPQTMAQALPSEDIAGQTEDDNQPLFSDQVPIQAALLDGLAVAGHTAINNGVVVEDLHDLEQMSQVANRHHATQMASLILRGDLQADGEPLRDSRIVNVPILIDSRNGAVSPQDRLFVDLIHSTLTQLVAGEDPVAPDLFVINFSVGIANRRFAGRVSPLAHLMDWWSYNYGILFVISAGNIPEDLYLDNISIAQFEALSPIEQRHAIQAAIDEVAYERKLLAPAEAANALTIGARSHDIHPHNPISTSMIHCPDATNESGWAQMTSALGLGIGGSVKPDLLMSGGLMEIRAMSHNGGSRVSPVTSNKRTGLAAADAGAGNPFTQVRGTSPAAALTTRAVIRAIDALTGPNGAYEGQTLEVEEKAVLGKVLAVHGSRWGEDARSLYNTHSSGGHSWQNTRKYTAARVGHGVLNETLMRESPENGVTLIGLGSVGKDEAVNFRAPLPPSLSGDKIPRTLYVSVAYLSPVEWRRPRYRSAILEVISVDTPAHDKDTAWVLNMKPDLAPHADLTKLGTAWSQKMIHKVQTCPNFAEEAFLPLHVQCRESFSGALSQGEQILFAIAVTLVVEAETRYDVHQEVESKLRVAARA